MDSMVFPEKTDVFPMLFLQGRLRKVPTWLSRASSQLPIGTLGGQGRTLAAADLPLGAMAPVSDDLGGSCRIFGCRSSMDPKKKAWNQDLDDGHMVVRFDKLFHRSSASMVVSSKCGLFLCKFGLDVLRQQHVSKENPLG